MNLSIIRYLMNLWRNSKLKEFENFMHGDNMDEYSLDQALEVIKYYESYHEELPNGDCRAYRDAIGKFTIGWGNTFYEDGSKVKEGDIITRERAESLLLHVVQDFKEDVLASLKTRLAPHELNALVSFTYNVGIGAFRKSTLLRKLNAGEKKEVVAKEFDRWVRGGNRVLKGLVRRRKTERILFETGEVVLNPQI